MATTQTYIPMAFDHIQKARARYMQDLLNSDLTPTQFAYFHTMMKRANEAMKMDTPEAAWRHYVG